jgi:transposase InsO family protein
LLGRDSIRRRGAQDRAGASSCTRKAASIVACDFFTVERVFLRRYYALFFIAHSSRRVWLAGCTTNPSGAWVTQQTRNLGLDFSEQGVRLLIRDRDSKYSGAFDEIFRSEGIRIVKTPVRAPKANAIAERFVRTGRSECLGWLLILNRRHSKACSASSSTTTTARGRIVPLNFAPPTLTRHKKDRMWARSTAATASVASSTSTTEPPPETRHE